jgi:hypothetical protein
MTKSSLIRINLIFTLLFIFIPHLTSAESKTFIKEYTYQASEFDSKASCRTIALEQVKRLLLEELGTYLENNTEVKNFELTKDKITALTAGIVQTQVLDERWDGKSYWLKAEVKADPENVAKSIDNLRKDQKKSDDLEERIKKHDAALKEIDKLRSEMALLKNDIETKEKYNKSVNTLTKVGFEAISSDSWQYPVRLGDLREKVHNLLGATSRTTTELEEYPESGLTVWFDRESRVTKLYFAGEAGTVYASASFDPIISKQQIIFGLTAHTDEAGFKRVLGGPTRESHERSTSVRELRCVWKKDGYVVDALFLAAERNHGGKTLAKGTLLWFEVFRGL